MFIYQVHLCCLGATFQHISWPNHGMTFLRASNPLRCTTLRPVSPIIWPILMTRFVARPIALSVTLVTGSAVGLVTNLYTGLGTKWSRPNRSLARLGNQLGKNPIITTLFHLQHTHPATTHATYKLITVLRQLPSHANNIPLTYQWVEVLLGDLI